MNKTLSGIVQRYCRWGLVIVLMGMITRVEAAPADRSISVTLGRTISRSLADVERAHYAYGPKQEFEGVTKETHIWLPYGSKGLYSETTAVKIGDPAPGTIALMMNEQDGFTCIQWGYKLRFDKPIRSFRLSAGMAELGLKNAVAGVEYSVDGRKWISIKETGESGTFNKFLDPEQAKVSGLNTRELTIRFYSRDKANPKAEQGESVWFKLWTAGDPGWGDAATTFFAMQPQLWVTAK